MIPIVIGEYHVVEAEKISNFLGLSVLGVTLLREGARLFSTIKPSMINHVNSRIVDGKIVCSWRRLFSLLVETFLFENFLSV